MERSYPGSIIVNPAGKRFSNESQNYMAFQQETFKLHSEENPCHPTWQVFDANFRASYFVGPLYNSKFRPDWMIPKSYEAEGFYARADSIRELAEKIAVDPAGLEETVSNLKGLSAGTLRISVVSTAKYFLPRILGPFVREHPGIDVEFNVGNRAEIIERMNHNRDDLYLFNDLPRDLDMVSHRFLPNPLAVIASRQHPLAGRRGLEWADLSGETFLMRERGSGTFNAIRRHLDEQGESLGKVMTIESNEAIKYAVVENMGITILSAYVLADAVAEGLVQLRVKGFPILSDWHVAHPREKPLSLLAERFLEFLLRKGPDVLPMDNLERQVERALSRV